MSESVLVAWWAGSAAYTCHRLENSGYRLFAREFGGVRSVRRGCIRILFVFSSSKVMAKWKNSIVLSAC